jgi:ElaB/YqjD/DUF883 family membrane-anchored ribosome-binding protein
MTFVLESIEECIAISASVLSSAVGAAGRETRHAIRKAGHGIQSRPLVSLGVAFGVGVVIGKLIDVAAARRS